LNNLHFPICGPRTPPCKPHPNGGAMPGLHEARIGSTEPPLLTIQVFG
jgi:hypothetical protein